jgi:hypothetical protein
MVRVSDEIIDVALYFLSSLMLCSFLHDFLYFLLKLIQDFQLP